MPEAAAPLTTTPGPPGPADGDVAALAARFRLLADQDFAGYSPAYDRIARRLADDPEALEVLLGLAPVNRTPVLALAATHFLALGEPDGELAAAYRDGHHRDPWPAFRRLLVERGDEVRSLMAARSIQTNEVGRAAALVPGLAVVAAAERLAGRARPLALVEVGPSAGLNLLLDRFSITYVDGRGSPLARTGPPTSPVRLRCELGGIEGFPPVAAGLDIAWRAGLDVRPVDVTDADERRWLAACVWPGVPERPERLAAAMALAAEDPPRLVQGDAVADLPALLAEVPPSTIPVVVATWALAYLDADGRRAVAAHVDAVGAHRDVALLTAEAAPTTPWVPAPDPPPQGVGTPTVLGLRHWVDGACTDRALGVLDPHGRTLSWLQGRP